MKKKLEEGKSPSTDCVEKAVRAVCTEKFAGDDESWKEVDPRQLKELLSKEMKSQYQLQPPIETSLEEAFAVDSPSENSDFIPEPESEFQEDFVSLPNELVADQPKVDDTSTNALEPFTTEDVEDTQDIDQTFFEEMKEYVSMCEGIAMDQKWIYFVDSGGQPQFHNVFQAFVKNTSILLLVFSLEKCLTDFNKHQFQDHAGCDIHLEDGSAPRVTDTLKSIASTLYAAESQEQRKIFLVGTHRDCCEACPEPIEMKEQQLLEIFSKDEIEVNTSMSRVIFPVNGLQAEKGEFDDEVVIEIRQKILGLFEQAKERPIPLRWFVLQLALDEKAASLNRSVLTYQECIALASHFCINDSSELHIAIKFLEDCSLLLFYPELELVLIDPQVLLSQFSTMVFKFYSKKFSGSVTEVSYAKKAILSANTFKELQNDSPETEVLTCKKTIAIFQSLLIATEVDEDKYFIPALLPSQDIEEVHKLRDEALSEESCTVPLVFLFSGQCTPSGLFCAVVVKLLASKDWKIDMDSEAYSNAVTLLHKKWLPDVKINLIDSFKYYEVHCSNNDRLQKVKENVELAIESVIEQRKYKCRPPKIAFFKCEEEKCMGLALLLEDGSIRCHCKLYEAEETVRERQWIQNEGVLQNCTYIINYSFFTIS